MLRILIVDDEPPARLRARQLLADSAAQIETTVVGEADSGSAALELADRLQPDVVLLDIHMPGMNGIELVRMVRSEARFASLPIAIVSYKDRTEDRAAGMDAGANAYLTKGSFQDQTFITTVNDLIGDSVS
jgi:two-component system sensor histidine kinase and response regulator WspE